MCTSDIDPDQTVHVCSLTGVSGVCICDNLFACRQGYMDGIKEEVSLH